MFLSSFYWNETWSNIIPSVVCCGYIDGLVRELGKYGVGCYMRNRFMGGVSFASLREESSQTNVILQYKLLASIVSAVCSVIQQS